MVNFTMDKNLSILNRCLKIVFFILKLVTVAGNNEICYSEELFPALFKEKLVGCKTVILVEIFIPERIPA